MTITRWRQRRTATGTGTVAPASRPGRPPTIGPAHAEALRAQVAQHPDATLAEHCRYWTGSHATSVSVATMSRAIRRLGITVKKRPARQ